MDESETPSSPSGTRLVEQHATSLTLLPSQQVAVMQVEAQELAKLLMMAARVTALLERCQQLEHDSPAVTWQAQGIDPAAMPTAANVLESLRDAATGAQRTQQEVLRQLLETSLHVSQHLSQAATLALRDLGLEASEQPDESAVGCQTPRGRLIQLRRSLATHGSGRPSQDDGGVEVGPDDEGKGPALHTSLREAAPGRSMPDEADTGRRPLDGWVLALTRFCSSYLLGPLATSSDEGDTFVAPPRPATLSQDGSMNGSEVSPVAKGTSSWALASGPVRQRFTPEP